MKPISIIWAAVHDAHRCPKLSDPNAATSTRTPKSAGGRRLRRAEALARNIDSWKALRLVQFPPRHVDQYRVRRPLADPMLRDCMAGTGSCLAERTGSRSTDNLTGMKANVALGLGPGFMRRPPLRAWRVPHPLCQCRFRALPKAHPRRRPSKTDRG